MVRSGRCLAENPSAPATPAFIALNQQLGCRMAVQERGNPRQSAGCYGRAAQAALTSQVWAPAKGEGASYRSKPRAADWIPFSSKRRQFGPRELERHLAHRVLFVGQLSGHRSRLAPTSGDPDPKGTGPRRGPCSQGRGGCAFRATNGPRNSNTLQNRPPAVLPPSHSTPSRSAP